MKDRAEQNKPVQSLQELTRLWLTAGDNSFTELFVTEEYSKAQGNLVTKIMEYRIHEQGVVEEMLKATHIPTRSEVDEAHRNIYELRKEVRALKKSLRESDKTNGKANTRRSRSRKSSTKDAAEEQHEHEQPHE
jgi:class III poly(R)-hydroxyalkanoic acid synthase PhaE subunit